MQYHVVALKDRVSKLERELAVSNLKLKQAIQRQKMLEAFHDEQSHKNHQTDKSEYDRRVVFTEIT